MAKRKPLKVRVAFTVEVDLDAYAAEYILDPNRATTATDARNYVNDIARGATAEALRLMDWGKVAE